MSLDDFVQDDDEPERDVSNILQGNDELFKDELCPRCGQEGKHLRGNEWRCTTPTSECKTLTWFTNNRGAGV